MSKRQSDSRLNLLILLTDQQRAPQHMPEGWVDQHLPSFGRLAAHGITFTQAFTAASECSPSRAALMTSTYPQENGVITTPGNLAPGMNNLAKVMKQAGYVVAYKGKWHLSDEARGALSPDFLVEYGADDWNPPEAGHTLGLDASLGGGLPNNDGRYVRGMDGQPYQTPGQGQSVLDFLDQYQSKDGPFCLFVSLVNPHDIHIIHDPDFEYLGYQRKEFRKLGLPPPANFLDSLTTKPTVQRELRRRWRKVAGDDIWDYGNFYAYLQQVVDRHIETVLNAVEERGLTASTLIIRASDHGEMALSHGLCQKMYNAYEETIRIPLIFSNPRLFPRPLQTSSLASLIDLLPTLARLAGVKVTKKLGWRGQNLGPILADPRASVREGALFTFDDPFFGGMEGPGRIRCLRQDQWKYAVYFDDAGDNFQFELYNLAKDPGEMDNLAYDRPVFATWRRLHRELTAEMKRSQATPSEFPWSAAAPRRWRQED